MFHRFRAAMVLGLVGCIAALIVAAPPVPAEKAPSVVPSDASMVISIDVAKLWDHPSFGVVRESRGKVEFAWFVQSFIGLPPGEIARITAFWPKADAGKEAAGPFVLVTGRNPIDPKKIAAAISRKGAPAIPKPADPRVLSAPGSDFPYLVPVTDRSVLLSPASAGADSKVLLAALEGAGNGSNPWAAAMAESAFVLGVDPSLLAGMPGGEKVSEAKSVLLTLNPLNEKSAKVTLTATFATADKAKDAVVPLRSSLAELAKLLESRQKEELTRPSDGSSQAAPLLEFLAATLKTAKVAASGSTLTATTDIDLNDGLYRTMLAMPESAFAARGTSAGENNLKQIALAMHNYESANGYFPSNSYGNEAKPLLSWRVHILPYIEQNALYQQFKLDEPWDSDNNKRLAQVIVRVYTVPGRPAPQASETYYRMFIQPKGTKLEDGNPWLKEGSSKGPKITEIVDGTSNTLMVVEAGESVPWTKPDDLPYDGKLPLPTLGGPSGRYSVAFADGSVQTFRRGQIDDVNLRRLITYNDGNIVNIPGR